MEAHSNSARLNTFDLVSSRTSRRKPCDETKDIGTFVPSMPSGRSVTEVHLARIKRITPWLVAVGFFI